MANPGALPLNLPPPPNSSVALKRLQRALRRTPNLGLTVNGIYTPALKALVIQFQQQANLPQQLGNVDAPTWAALPDGRPMPTLQLGSTGAVVKSLQQVLTNGAPGAWNVGPGLIDGIFGPQTKASVQGFQTWGGVTADGIVGDQTWSVSLHAMSATLETQVGLNFIV